MNVSIVSFGWEGWERVPREGEARGKPSKDGDEKKPNSVFQTSFLCSVFSIKEITISYAKEK